MNKGIALFLTKLFLCSCLSAVCLAEGQTDPRAAPGAYTIPRQVQYSFTVSNRTGQPVRDGRFWTYAPVKETSSQRFVELSASHPSEMIVDPLGNQVLHMTFPLLSPYATKIITVRADLLLSHAPNPIQVRDPEPYLRPEKFCESDSPEISELAKTLRATEPLKTAENVFRWVRDHVQYSGYVKNARGALYALEHKRGDCTEFMYLFMALCRSNHIPARGMGGYKVGANAVLSPKGYHNWAEFYVDGQWRVADPQQGAFMENESHYIAMRIIGDPAMNPMRGHSRFRFEGEGLSVRMNG